MNLIRKYDEKHSSSSDYRRRSEREQIIFNCDRAITDRVISNRIRNRLRRIEVIDEQQHTFLSLSPSPLIILMSIAVSLSTKLERRFSKLLLKSAISLKMSKNRRFEKT